jgi:putative ABC transport system permease protein
LPGEERAIVASDTIYNFYPDLKLGDSLIIKLPGRREEQWQVVGIFPFVALLGDPVAYANFEFIAERNHLPNQATSYRIITEAHDAAFQDALTRRIDRYLVDRNFAVQSVQSGYFKQEKAKLVLNTVIIFLLIMAILTAFVGSIGLTGMMSINVLERTREIGVMRTIGAVDRVIMQSVTIEALVIGLITWLLAIGLSFPISFLLLKIIGEAISGLTVTLSFTPLGILLWLAVVIILSVFASILPARNAARLTINEVLAYE